MINRIMNRLDCPIETVADKGGTLFFEPGTYPEYAVLLRMEGSEYVIYNVQREKLFEFYRAANCLEAELYAVMFLEKKFKGLDYDNIKIINDFIENHDITDILDFFNKQPFREYFSIGTMKYDKISLLTHADKGTIYFHERTTPNWKDGKVKSSFGILANYSHKLMYVTELYGSFTEEEKSVIDFDRYVEKYIFI